MTNTRNLSVHGTRGLYAQLDLEGLHRLREGGRPHSVDGSIPEPDELESLLNGCGGRDRLLRGGPAERQQFRLEGRGGRSIHCAGDRQPVRFLQ